MSHAGLRRARSKEQEARSRKQGAGSEEQEVRSKEQEARSKKRGARSKEQGARSEEHTNDPTGKRGVGTKKYGIRFLRGSFQSKKKIAMIGHDKKTGTADKVRPVLDGYHTVTPFIIAKGAARFLDS